MTITARADPAQADPAQAAGRPHHQRAGPRHRRTMATSQATVPGQPSAAATAACGLVPAPVTG
jgi:hypothetical protein